LVSLPDYVGYGISDHLEHPYSVNDRLAEQSVDMILATQAFAKEVGIELANGTYLSGWSEGAAAGLATQKLIEQEYQGSEVNADNIYIAGNFALAGFYNTVLYSKLFTGLFPLDHSDWGEDLDILLWTLYTINKYSDDQPLDSTSLFKIPAANQLDVLKNRQTSVPAEITPFTISDKNRLISKFAKNSLSNDWTPKAPIYIHHGTEDDIVYYPFNTELTVQNLKEKGGNVTLIKYQDHDHYTPAKLFLLDMLEILNTSSD